MGMPVLIIGKSGSGKSASLRNFKKGELGLIKVIEKPLPFKNEFKPISTDNYNKIKGVLKKAKTNSIVIDDASYLLTNAFMHGQGSNKGSAIFDFYAQLATNFWDLINTIMNDLPEEKIVYLVMHEDKNENGDIKPKTIGKMLDEKVCVEGMFTIVLRSMRNENGYIFRTQTTGLDVAKTPIGMFDSEEIENDLKEVDKAIREYYNLEPKKEEKGDDTK